MAQCRIARCFTSDARKHPSSGSVTLSWELLRSYSSFGCFECSFYNASIYVWPLRSPWLQCAALPETFVHLLGRQSCPHAFDVLMRRGEDLTKQTLSKRALDPRIEKEVPQNYPAQARFSGDVTGRQNTKASVLTEAFIYLQNFFG